MNHLDVISSLNVDISEEFRIRATGRYYTHEKIASYMLPIILSKFSNITIQKLKIADPFAGDGRLIVWLIETWIMLKMPQIHWDIYLFDIQEEGLNEAASNLDELKANGISLEYTIKSGDSFKNSTIYNNAFDIVVTNPPWELLKPDSRELMELDQDEKDAYVLSMKNYDNYLAQEYPLSQPQRKFAGWGTNLSRVGAELSYNICKKDGFAAIVLPASFFADGQSTHLRKQFLSNCNIYDIAYYPAEAKLFGKADVASSSLVFKKTGSSSNKSRITVFDKLLEIKSSDIIDFKFDQRQDEDYMIPVTLGGGAIKLLDKMRQDLPSWHQLEKSDGQFWAGREVDETGSANWLSNDGDGPKFIKGKMIDRYKIVEEPYQYINKDNWSPPVSCNYERVAWRDVSRPNQKRRVIATIISTNTAAGNSLSVAYFKDGDKKSLYSLLAIMNSLCFEFQLRCHLATGHISLSAVRKVHLPPKDTLNSLPHLIEAVNDNLNKNTPFSPKAEAIVAKEIYGLNQNELSLLMNSFEKLTTKEKEEILKAFNKLPEKNVPEEPKIKIPNHLSSKLSELDMAIVHSVPPGGNWKNIPEDIPSKRIAQIRESYAQGKGSRSTYYGRLLSSMPSYTINTYFNRPGNGCHIHYSQNRVLSQREAARLQSFPDDFVFHGPQTAVNTQIGNAVPPLLAYQIAKEVTEAIGDNGVFIDLFSGAGGMGLGFKWAGWEPLLANDIESRFIETYTNNVHSNAIVGSIANNDTFSLIVERCKKLKTEYPNKQFWVLGGPPCQGFSTAGNKRSMDDERNTLFLNYKEFLEEIVPDGFVFENVSGLLSMEKGKVFERVKSEFNSVMPSLTGWLLNTEDYAIPQRRKRVILVGSQNKEFRVSQPEPKTYKPNKENLFSELKDWVSVDDALSDLPSINQGENGSHLDYKTAPQSLYQKLMRGMIEPEEYLSEFLDEASPSK